MPIPTPRKKESQSKYVSRCMGFFSRENTNLERKQQLSICYDKYRKWNRNRKRKAKAKLSKSKDLVSELRKLKDFYDTNYRISK